MAEQMQEWNPELGYHALEIIIEPQVLEQPKRARMLRESVLGSVKIIQ